GRKSQGCLRVLEISRQPNHSTRSECVVRHLHWWRRKRYSLRARAWRRTSGHHLPIDEVFARTTTLLADGLELAPLLHRKHFAQIEIHHGKLALQFAPGG